MRRDVGLVRRCRVISRVHAAHARPNEGAVHDRAHVSGERALENVEAKHLALLIQARLNKGLAEVTGTACNKNLHTVRIPETKSRRRRQGLIAA